jgi:hypothetical protein
MATITFPGIEQYEKQLEQIGRQAPRILGRALYDGAGILADAVQEEIKGLDRLDPKQREGLSKGLGIASFWEENGNLQTKIGFEGYNRWKTKRWPRGQPNAMIARATIRGTSWMMPNRFTDRAARKARERCIKAMQTRMDRELADLTK